MNEVDKITTEVPPSGVPLKMTTTVVPTLDQYSDNLSAVYKFYGADVENSYKKGTNIRVNNDVSSTVILEHIVGMYIDTVRTKLQDVSSEEERKELLVHVNKIGKALTALISMLDNDNFKLDINSIVHIIHGYINTNVKQIS